MASLLDKPVLLLDGGLGTTLEDEHGTKFSSETPLWSSHLLLSSPKTLSNVQTDFAQAGADIILTATYQASFYGFRKTLINGQPIQTDEAKQYMLSSLPIARSAFQGRQGLVALSLGAYGATTIPSTEFSGEYGSMTESDLVDFHRERLEVFTGSDAWSSIDIVAFETLPRLDEVKAVRKVIRDAPPKPYWISCVFPKPDDDNLPDGSTVGEVAKAMLEGERKPDAVGINCTKIRKVPDLILQFEKAIEDLGIDFPKLVVYPDGAGNQVYNPATQQWVEKDHGTGAIAKAWDEMMFEIIRDVQERGKWPGVMVGGCCKTAPRMIRSLRARLDDI